MAVEGRLDMNASRTKRRKLSHDSEPASYIEVPSLTSESDQNDTDTLMSDDAQDEPSRVTESKPSPVLTGLQTINAVSLDKSSALIEQLQQLLGDSAEPDTLTPLISTFLDRVTGLIRSTPEIDAFSLDQAEDWLQSRGCVAIPFPSPRPPKNSNIKFHFQRGDILVSNGLTRGRVKMGGSRFMRCDVAMPRSILQDKDYLNLRAFHKRAFYLACIAAHIAAEAEKEFEVSYVHDDEIELLPMLRLRVKQRESSQHDTEYMVAVSFPGDTFPKNKCDPTRNCIRPNGHVGGSELPPTPFYNSCLLSQTGVRAIKDMLDKKIQSCEALREACWIGQKWLLLRGFSSEMSCGGFGISEMRLMGATLLETGGHHNYPLFSDRYSQLQLFKAILQVLAGRDLTEPWILRTPSLSIPPSDCPTFYDDKLGFNTLYKMSPWCYQRLRQEAQLSLTALNAKSGADLDTIFCTVVAEPALRYDEVITIALPNSVPSQAAHSGEAMQKLYRVIRRGLGDRVNLLTLKTASPTEWPLHNSHSHRSTAESLLEVGLLLKPEAIMRLVDHGPSADQHEEAADFQSFWGDKAELRRFKDGSISESLVWSSNEAVTFQIIRHLVAKHFNTTSSAVTYRSHKLESMLLPSSSSLSAANAFNLINTEYQTLASTLRQLENLPLPIRSISPADAVLRSATSTHPMGASDFVPVDVLIQFDSSTRWPDSLPAIQHTKIAFLVKLSDLLAESKFDMKVRVGLENTSTATSGHLNTSFLDIIYPPPGSTLSPVCFRLRIHHDRELHLLQYTLADKSLRGSVRDQFTAALTGHKRHFLAAPSHTTAIRNLVTKFLPLSPSIRLLKKWTSSHLLSRLIPEEILETVAANVFLHPYPWSSPGSATTAFFRCLHFLSEWDWTSKPLIVDLSLSQDMTLKQREDLKTRFQAWRKLDPSMNNVVWFVGTNVDDTGVVWTQGARPEKVVASRVSALALAAMDVIVAKGLDASEEDMKGLFKTPMEKFDFQLHLRKDVVRGAAGRKKLGDGGFKNLQVATSLDYDRIGFDPVELYLQDLENAFGNVALFFYDSNGGKVIAGLWRPAVLGRKEWRVRTGYSTVPIIEKGKEGEEDKVMGPFNRAAVFAEMKLMGEGLVKNLTAKQVQ